MVVMVVVVVVMVSVSHHANKQLFVPQHALSHVTCVQVLVQVDALQAVHPHVVR